MNKDDILKMDELYVCQQCFSAFLFKDEVEDHKRKTGHPEIIYTSLEEWR